VARERTNNQLNSYEVPEPRIEPNHWTTAVRGERITATPPYGLRIDLTLSTGLRTADCGLKQKVFTLKIFMV
jgi:hypothetical protein